METYRRRLWVSTLCTLVAAVSATACVHKPLTAPVAIVPETTPSEIRVAAVPASRFGDMVAFGVGLSNGAATPYLVSGTRIFAVDRAGRRVAPLTVDEAARQAGGVTALAAGLQGAGGGALLAGLMGAVPGAILGAAHSGGGAGKGAAVGAGIGLAVGAASGFFESKKQTELEITHQLQGVSLRDQVLDPGVPVSGFVFYPSGHYVGVRAVLIEAASGRATEIAGALLDSDS